MTPTLTSVALTTGTISTTPTTATEIANKSYVDTQVSSGITYHTAVKYEVPNTTGNLTATYNQPGGAGVGVGATLTNAGAQAAFAPDGPTASVSDRILVYNQTNAFENGIYEVTTVGSGSTNWVLTRTTDADTYASKSPNGLGQGDAFFVTSGDTGAGETYVLNTVGTITFGVTALTFVQVSDSTLYTAGNGLQLTSGTQFSLISPVVTTNGGTGLTSFTSGGAVYATFHISPDDRHAADRIRRHRPDNRFGCVQRAVSDHIHWRSDHRQRHEHRHTLGHRRKRLLADVERHDCRVDGSADQHGLPRRGHREQHRHGVGHELLSERHG
jgi:hypothetical protein